MSLPRSTKAIFLSPSDTGESIPSETVSDIRSVCKDLLGSAWKSIPDEKLSVRVVTGGISNALFKVTPPESESSDGDSPYPVLVRVFGPGDQDRDSENSLVTHLDRVGFGPKIYGFFKNGRIEGFISNSRSLDYSDMRKPEFLGRIAAQLSTLHNLDMPGDNKPILFTTLRKWYETAVSAGFDVDPDQVDAPREKEKNRVYQTLDMEYVAEQLKWLQRVLPSRDNDYGTDLLSNRLKELFDMCHFVHEVPNVNVVHTHSTDGTNASSHRVELATESQASEASSDTTDDWTMPSIATPWLSQLKTPKIAVSPAALEELSKATLRATVRSPRVSVKTERDEDTGRCISHLVVGDHTGDSSDGDGPEQTEESPEPQSLQCSALCELACLQARIDAACFLFRTVFAHNDLLAGNILEVVTPQSTPSSTPRDTSGNANTNNNSSSSASSSNGTSSDAPAPAPSAETSGTLGSSEISSAPHSGQGPSEGSESHASVQDANAGVHTKSTKSLEKLNIRSTESVAEPSPRTPNITSLQYLSTLPPLHIIDYEYSSFNPAGFDIANHFLEFAGFDFDLSLFPSHSAMAEWFVAYLQAMDVDIPTIHTYFPPEILAKANIPPPALGTTTSASGTSQNDSETECPVFDAVSSAFFDELFRIIYLFTLPSHYFWALWAIIQARYSTIRFDYMSYAKRRLNGYDQQKKDFSEYLPR